MITQIEQSRNLTYTIPFIQPRYRVGNGYANGTFGELLQGVLPANEGNFLVTMPITSFSHVLFVPDYKTEQITVYPAHKKKSIFLAQEILKIFNIEIGGKLIIESDLLEGKGLASSSADLVATAKAVLSAIDRNISLHQLHRLLRKIEPTDGVMYDECVAFYHRRIELHSKLGMLPPLTIIGVDEGGEIDTIEYNKNCHFFYPSQKEKYQTLLTEMAIAFRKNDVKTIGRIATQSSLLNQQYNPKKTLDFFMEISHQHQALGVIIAHSGTCIGLLLDERDPKFLQKKFSIMEEIKKINSEILLFRGKAKNINLNHYFSRRNSHE